jgi:hypothetical protein
MFTPKPAPAVQPVYVQQAPVAMAPIYASGRALPAAQPYLIVPVRGGSLVSLDWRGLAVVLLDAGRPAASAVALGC